MLPKIPKQSMLSGNLEVILQSLSQSYQILCVTLLKFIQTEKKDIFGDFIRYFETYHVLSWNLPEHF